MCRLRLISLFVIRLVMTICGFPLLTCRCRIRCRWCRMLVMIRLCLSCSVSLLTRCLSIVRTRFISIVLLCRPLNVRWVRIRVTLNRIVILLWCLGVPCGVMLCRGVFLLWLSRWLRRWVVTVCRRWVSRCPLTWCNLR